MKTSYKTLLVLLAAAFAAPGSLLAGAPSSKMKALLITGGCCHDYDNQKTIIPEGISSRTGVEIEWTVVHTIGEPGKKAGFKVPTYNDPNWADGYDIVVHNECYAAVNDSGFVANVLKPHREGTPAVLVHCAMHSYRVGSEDWFAFCGATSHRHGPHHNYTVELMTPDHEITKGIVNWTTPKGELYFITKTFPTMTPLAQSKSNATGEMHPNIWVNEYGPNKTRVFSTTIGHHNETMEDPNYLNMITRGFLWAAGLPVDANVKDASK